MKEMFDGLQVVEKSAQKQSVQMQLKPNHGITERAMLLVMAATIGLSTIALVGVLTGSA